MKGKQKNVQQQEVLIWADGTFHLKKKIDVHGQLTGNNFISIWKKNSNLSVN